MARRKLGLVAQMALENDITMPPADPMPEDGDLGEHAESLETELLDVNEDEAQADADDEKMEEAVETCEALESMRDCLKTAAANGGLDRYAAQAVEVAVSYMYQRVGINRSKAMPALESFGGSSTRIGATKIAIESLTEQIKKIWESIKAAIRHSIEWVMDRFGKIFNGADKLIERAKKAAEMADKTDSSAPKEKSFQQGVLSKSLHIGGTVPGNASGAEALHGMSKLVFADFANKSINEGEAIAAAFEKFDPKNIQSDAITKAEKMGERLPGCEDVSNPAEFGFAEPAEGLALARSKELPGGKAIINYYANPSSVEALNAFAEAHAVLGEFNPKHEGVKGDDVPVLTTTDAKKVAQLVAEVGEEVKKYKADLDKLKVIKEKIVHSLDKVIPKEGEEWSDEVKKFMDVAKKLAAAVPKKLDQPAASFAVYALNTGKNLLDQVELSLKQYNAGTAVAAPAPAAA